MEFKGVLVPYHPPFLTKRLQAETKVKLAKERKKEKRGATHEIKWVARFGAACRLRAE